MFRNYLKIALRQLLKQKMYSAIKIGGFALGIAACLLIALFIRNELSYDSSYPNADRIYRIVGEFNDNGVIDKGTSTPAPMAQVLKTDFPEIEKVGRLMPNSLFPGAGSNYLRAIDQQQNNYENGFTYADQAILDILNIPMVYGNREHALDEPNTIVISKKKADKYFPNQNPVGKSILLNDDKNRPYKISGVMHDFPPTSHLQYDFLLTLTGIEFWPGEQSTWRASNYDNYVLLRTGTDVSRFEKKITSAILKNYVIPSMQLQGNKDVEKVKKSASLHLQPVKNIHLKSFDIDDGLSHGDIRFIWLFGAIACFILIIACINFINLSTAKSANRAKEVGLRKVVGSHRTSLVQQFLTESLLFSFLSFIIGMLLARLLLPYFNLLAAKSLSIPWNEWWLIPIVITSSIIIGIVAGIYPSFYLSSFKPINVLKGQLSRGSKNSTLRNGLVVFQFTTSIILIISTFVIYNQMQFILNTKLGFNKDQVILIEGTNTLGNDVKNFKNELLKLPQVESVSISDFLPVAGTKRNGNTFWNEGKIKEESGTDSQFWIVDEDYVNTLGMKIIAGRNFSSKMPSDSQAVIINQTLANQLNLKDPIGKRITNGNAFQVVGVVEDFHFESMRDNIEGLCMSLGSSPSIVSVKINTANIRNLVPSVTSLWKKFAPGQPIRYNFLDESFANMYADVQRMARIFTSFAILAIIIACLGLFALSAFLAEQRSKEIGIRKVLGATISQLTSLLSKDFIKLVLIAVLVASPIAWWAMNKWLQDFVYRVNISAWVFIAAGIAALFIALITVSFQSIKAALDNPVKSLRSE
ncbi:MAG: ABC transporter permease [Flavitalea sp.]